MVGFGQPDCVVENLFGLAHHHLGHRRDAEGDSASCGDAGNLLDDTPRKVCA